MPLNRGLITIAIGKKYASEARYLAYSCMIHAPHITRSVITDQVDYLKEYFDVIIPYEKYFGDPFILKTRLPIYTPFEKTMYVDADSLIIRNFDSLWEHLNNHAVVYSGALLKGGIWYMDISRTIKKFNIEYLPKFNSGMMLFDSSKKARSIFSIACEYMKNPGDLNIDCFRKNMLPDEPFFSISLALHGEQPTEDFGRFSRTLIKAEKIHVDAIRGIASFVKEGRPVFPLIVHFCGRFGQIFYFFEKTKLYLYFHPPVILLFNNLLSLCRKLYFGVLKKT
jgi:hypothetical protein